jgi:hypothetical protein
MADPTSSTASSGVKSATVPEEHLKFELFPKLPPELRFKIWNLVPEPRIVRVLFRYDRRKNHYKFDANFPPILHVNQEARTEGLRRYTRAFETKWALNGVFFDFEADILYLSPSSSESQKNLFVRKVRPAEFAKVQNFAAAGYDVNYGRAFPGMKKLIFVCFLHNGKILDLGVHKCGSAGGQLVLHELKDLMAQNPDQHPTLKGALSYSEARFAGCRSFGRHNLMWQEPKGCKVVHAVLCQKGPRKYSIV